MKMHRLFIDQALLNAYRRKQARIELLQNIIFGLILSASGAVIVYVTLHSI